MTNNFINANTNTMNSDNNTIKHIVISSGGPAGHMMYSILRTLNLKGVWDINNIKTIYGSSIGAYIAVILALRYDWQVMDDYLIKRPWDKIFMMSSSVSATSNDKNTDNHNTGSAAASAASTFADAKNKLDYVCRLYNNHGLYGLKEFTEMLRPPLQGKDISVNVTFQEFYERTGIELHFIVTELNKFQVIDFSYKTHPNQSVVEACYMSGCYPLGFTPIYRDGCCYVDGGIINDYPVNECIRDQKCNLTEILGVKMMWERKPANLSDKSSIFQFISTFFNQIKSNLFENRPTRAIPNEVVCVSKVFSSQDWLNCIKDENYRRELVLRGETFANVFLSYRRNYHEASQQTQLHSEQSANSVPKTTSNHLIQLPVTILEENTSVEPTPEPEQTHEPEPETVSVVSSENTTSFEVHNADMTMV
jgi:predicted acylesterase/phospholipase RssA